jgi:hypothetical protein
MDDALRDALPIEALQFLDEIRVLEENRAVRTRGLGILVIADRRTTVARHVFGMYRWSESDGLNDGENARCDLCLQ